MIEFRFDDCRVVFLLVTNFNAGITNIVVQPQTSYNCNHQKRRRDSDFTVKYSQMQLSYSQNKRIAFLFIFSQNYPMSFFSSLIDLGPFKLRKVTVQIQPIKSKNAILIISSTSESYLFLLLFNQF